MPSRQHRCGGGANPVMMMRADKSVCHCTKGQ